MPAEIIQLSNRVMFDGTGTAPSLNFPAPTRSGNSVILIAVTNNSTNNGSNITAVSDSASQSYTQAARVSSANQLMQLSAHIGYNLTTAIQTLNVSRIESNTAVSMIAIEVKDLTASAPIAIDTRTGAANVTQLDLTTAATVDPHSFVIGAVGWHWNSTPKNALVPDKYLLVDQQQTPVGGTLAYQIVQRPSSTTRAKTARWAFAAQANGALGFLLAFKSQPATRRIRVPISSKIVTATNIKYEVYTLAPDNANPVGSYVVTGTLPTAPTDVYNDLVDLTLPVDTNNTLLEDGDQTVVFLEGTSGSTLFTNNFSLGYTYVQSTSSSGTGAANITTNSGNPLTVNIASGTYAVSKFDATGAPTIVWSVSDTTNFTISQTGQLSMINPATVSRTVTVTATNTLGASSIAVTVNVTSTAVEWGLTANAGGLRATSTNAVVRLRGMNLFGVIPFGVTGSYDTGVNLDHLSTYLSSSDMMTTLKTTFGSWFNCIRVPVSPMTLNASYPAQRTRLLNLLTSAAARGVYVMAVPYGAGAAGDFPSRNNSDGTQDETNASAITTEVRAVHDALAALVPSNPNLLIGLLHAPRAVAAATWRNQCNTWITNLRSKGYTQPIFVDAPSESYNAIGTADVASIRATDANVVFTHQMFRDSGTPGTVNPANTAIPGQWATVRGTANVVTGISAIGRSTIGADLGTGDAAWMTSYLGLWGSNTPIVLGWTTLYDYNSVFGSVTGNSLNWISVVNGAQPPTLNAYGQSLAAALNPS